MMLYRDSKFKDFLKCLIDENACKEGIDFFTKELSLNNEITVGEELDKVIKEMTLKESWVFGVFQIFKSYFGIKLREDFLSQIKDPMIAFTLYLETNDLTEKEEVILKEKFEGQLPRAEKELQDNIVSRCIDG